MSQSIILILQSKPHNSHYLKRYIKYIEEVSKYNNKYTITGYQEQHHILPKAKDLFPEYSSFKEHPWNKIPLTARQHFIAHHLLYKAFGGSQTAAFKRMYESNQNTGKLSSRQYETLKEKFSEYISSCLTGLKRSPEYCEEHSKRKTEFYKDENNRKKQSQACLGIKRSEQAKENMRVAFKNRPPKTKEQKDHLSKIMTGRVVSEETRNKMRGNNNPNYGITMSESHRKNISDSSKNVPKKTCEHCGKQVSPGNYTRWHGEKCRG
ncbi:MAG TPA: hypothetical protein DCS83_07830 [Prevotella sp.]|nr:hypothetical protein [Prevotella sp.]